MRFLAVFLACLSVAAISFSSAGAVGTIDSFQLVKHFKSPGGAEIVDASPDGNRIVISDAGGAIHVVNIANPASPVVVGSVDIDGSPSSAAYTPDGDWIVVAAKTYDLGEGDPAPAALPAGILVVIDAATLDVAGTVEIGIQPDSVKTYMDGADVKVLIAIENEPVGAEGGVITDLEDAGDPSDISDPGYVQVVTIDTGDIPGSAVVDIMLPEVDMTGCFFTDDPQPEFVDINGTTGLVSLQENNCYATLDLTDDTLIDIFPAGIVDDRAADLESDSVLSFTDTYPADVAGEDYAGARFPDSIAFTPDGSHFFSSDEGEFDYTGGRGVSGWDPFDHAAPKWDDGGQIELNAVVFGMYPEGRSDAKGTEMEGLDIGTFDGTTFAFFLSERGSFMAVYDVTDPEDPQFVQMLGTGIAPEGVIAIPGRNLVVTVEEEVGTVSIFEGVDGDWTPDVNRPQIYSDTVDVPWCALSGLDAEDDEHLVTVTDSAFQPTQIFRIGVDVPFAPIDPIATVNRAGEPWSYDGEGIAIDDSVLAPANPGWWLGVEGNAAFAKDGYLPNLLVQVDGDGDVLREIVLPEEVDSPGGGMITSNGYEGVAISGDGEYALAPIQRRFSGEGNEFTRIARVALDSLECTGLTCTGDWEFFMYPLDAIPEEATWVALSELSHIEGDTYAVVERDNAVGGPVKKVYVFSLDGLEDGDVISKELWVDVAEDFFPYEKVEGVTLAGGDLWVNMDNDCGESESRIINYGQVELPDLEPAPTVTPAATNTPSPTATTVPPSATSVPPTATNTVKAPMPPNTGSGSVFGGGSGQFVLPMILFGATAMAAGAGYLVMRRR